jgi:hypothetical protein
MHTGYTGFEGFSTMKIGRRVMTGAVKTALAVLVAIAAGCGPKPEPPPPEPPERRVFLRSGKGSILPGT